MNDLESLAQQLATQVEKMRRGATEVDQPADSTEKIGADPTEGIAIISAEVAKIPSLAFSTLEPRRYDKTTGEYCGDYQAVNIYLDLSTDPVHLCEFRLAVGEQRYEGFSAEIVNALTPELVRNHIRLAILQMLGETYEVTIPENITRPLFDSNTGRPLAQDEKAPVAMGYETHSQVTGLPMRNVGSGMVIIEKEDSFLTVTSYEAELLKQQGWFTMATAKSPNATPPPPSEMETIALRQALASI